MAPQRGGARYEGHLYGRPELPEGVETGHWCPPG